MRNEVLVGDMREVCASLPEDSVDCVITSPPYWGLRAYQGETEAVWGGRRDCEHVWGEHEWKHGSPVYKTRTRWQHEAGGSPATHPDIYEQGTRTGDRVLTSRFCQLCHAWFGELGREPTPELYVEHMVECMEALKGPCKPHSPVWLNIGDSYAGPRGDHHGAKAYKGSRTSQYVQDRPIPIGLKPLDMVQIPQRLSLALQSAGWYVRSWVVWHKHSPMPESINGWRWERHRVTECPNCGALASFYKRQCRDCDWEKGNTQVEYVDCPGCEKCLPNDLLVLNQGNWRPTSSHEFVFLLAQDTPYFCDGEGMREAPLPQSIERAKYGYPETNKGAPRGADRDDGGLIRSAGFTDVHLNPAGRNARDVQQFVGDAWSILSELTPDETVRAEMFMRQLVRERAEAVPDVQQFRGGGYSGPHFAVFPESLPYWCIRAGSSARGVCPECGMPWARVVDRKLVDTEGWGAARKDHTGPLQGSQAMIRHNQGRAGYSISTTLGWRATCTCDAERELRDHPERYPRTKDARKRKAQDHSTWMTWRVRAMNHAARLYADTWLTNPSLILDPFGGSGTTALAAKAAGREYCIIEISDGYAQLARDKIRHGTASGGKKKQPLEIELNGLTYVEAELGL